MKNAVKLFGIIAIVAIIGFTLVACGVQTKDDEILEATTAGRLTITGMSAYNGQEIDVSSNTLEIFPFGRATNIYNPNEGGHSGGGETFPATVSGGQAVLKVFVDVGWKSGKGGGYQSYTGNDQNVEFFVSRRAGSVNSPIGSVIVTFSNGIANGALTPAP